MKIEFIELEYLDYYIGDPTSLCLVDALHAKPPQSDLFTGEIVERVISNVKCAGIISKVSRTVADLNRKMDGSNDAALQQYRATIKKIFKQYGILDEQSHQITKPVLHLSIHGMKDEHYGRHAIEVGTFQGQSCSKKMRSWFQRTIRKKSNEILPNTRIVFDEYFDGDESIVYHRMGDGDSYEGYGPHFHTFQIEFSKTLREDYQSEIVELITQIINERSHP
ncbi:MULTISPECIES: hypothetical protein [unclassified Bacillus (in: firmicutes)]|uniref:hypothetical protein n=1 Tax=unclassified Bacillus (in: firmicutes) TaxID=185979 RepID=UPI0008EE3B47|nr:MULTISPECIES: hypothetical protein [unclassified Bacillus (in: firmicutes)]SFA77926.1 hypothetical protein SAMN02799634_101709 [Bacillus sp. UNCCL13]SFQ67811.1 hypothetical protein SAMN04488577_0983 [Bacillus sp. cl95]